MIWNYFGWANQTLAVFTLWTITVYLVQQKKPFVVTILPAVFMTVVCSTFLVVSKNAFGASMSAGYVAAVVSLVVALVWFFSWYRKNNK